MRIYGLTGGIASGKSTVSGMLRGLGAHVIDADVLAREVVAPGTPGLREVVQRFGDVLTPEGALDRKRLGARVFASEAERRALEAILHPRIQAAFLEKTWAMCEEGVEAVVYDAALLFERGLDAAMTATIVVWIPGEAQLERLMARDGLGREEAQARIASQAPLDEKRAKATHVIDNSGSREETRAQVEALWARLRDAKD